MVNINGENEIDGKNQFSMRYTQQIDDYWNFTSFTTFDKRKKLKCTILEQSLNMKMNVLEYLFVGKTIHS